MDIYATLLSASFVTLVLLLGIATVTLSSHSFLFNR